MHGAAALAAANNSDTERSERPTTCRTSGLRRMSLDLYPPVGARGDER